MVKMASAVLLACVLAGCAATTTTLPPPGYTVCATQPGTYACQIEQYERVNE